MSDEIDSKIQDSNYQGVTETDNLIVNELIYSALPENSPLRDKFKKKLLAELQREIFLCNKDAFDADKAEVGTYLYVKENQLKIKYKYAENNCSHEITITPSDLDDDKYYRFLFEQCRKDDAKALTDKGFINELNKKECEILSDNIRTLIFKKNNTIINLILEKDVFFNSEHRIHDVDNPAGTHLYSKDNKLYARIRDEHQVISDEILLKESTLLDLKTLASYAQGNDTLTLPEQKKFWPSIKSTLIKTLEIPSDPIKNQRKIDALNSSTISKEAILIEDIVKSEIIFCAKDDIRQSDNDGIYIYRNENTLKVTHKDALNNLSQEIELSEEDFSDEQKRDFWRAVAYLQGDVLLSEQEQQTLWASLKSAAIKKIIIPNDGDDENFTSQILYSLFQTSHVYTTSSFLHFMRLGMIRFMGLTENEPSAPGNAVLTSLQMLYGFLLIFDMTIVISNALQGKGNIQQSLLKGNRIHRMLDSFVWLTVNYIRLSSDNFLHMGVMRDLSPSLSFGILSIAFAFDLINQAWANYKDIQRLKTAIKKVEAEGEKDPNEKNKQAFEVCKSKLEQQLFDKKIECGCNAGYALTLVSGAILVSLGESAFFQAAFEVSAELVLSGLGIIAGVTALNYVRKCTVEVIAANRERKKYDEKIAQLTEIEILMSHDDDKKCKQIDSILKEIYSKDSPSNPTQENIEKRPISTTEKTAQKKIEAILRESKNGHDWYQEQILERFSFFNANGTINYKELNKKLNTIDPSYESDATKQEKMPEDTQAYLRVIKHKKKSFELKSSVAIKNIACSIAYYSILCAGAVASLFLIGNPWILGAVLGALLIYAVVAKSGLLDKLIKTQLDSKYKRLSKEEQQNRLPITPQFSEERNGGQFLPISEQRNRSKSLSIPTPSAHKPNAEKDLNVLSTSLPTGFCIHLDSKTARR